MSSRFVSAGTINSLKSEAGRNEEAAQREEGANEVGANEVGANEDGVKQGEGKTQRQPGPLAPPPARLAEWEAVQREMEAERKRREETRLKAAAGEQKSLYAILQENKAAKQAAFEEKHKLKNQFRALDVDEADFLDEVRERARKHEEALRRETEDGVRAFREKQQQAAEADEQDGERIGVGALADEGEPDADEAESWAVCRGKRKRGVRDRDGRLVRKMATDDGRRRGGAPATLVATPGDGSVEQPAATPALNKAVSALVDYGSDDSDE